MFFEPKPEAKTPERPQASVEVVIVEPQSVCLKIQSQGTVLPKTESTLAVEVSGRIIEVADNFRPGAHFDAGDILFKIDPIDYTVAVASRQAELAMAELNLAQEEALFAQAAADWNTNGNTQTPSALTLRKPQLKRAKAVLSSAHAQLGLAQRNLERTQIKAPYTGRVLTKSADLGQLVSASSPKPIAEIYATDFAEIRLPLSQKQAGYLDDLSQCPAKVILRYKTNAWEAQLVRLEGTIDTKSRLLYGVALISNPFDGTNKLRRGQFLQAEIEGRTLDEVYVIPRLALRGSDTVYVLTENNTLQRRLVGVVKSSTKSVIIDRGLEPGDRVATSPIAYFVENMPVTLIEPSHDSLVY
ncbi:MAG: efflux RND transporter periplasmic adaptor subunit [Verrucomicrobiota bacterium]|nr:efflux RND transporter periplasmic adaptor subunit [Verrucomicrobiota bacterium]